MAALLRRPMIVSTHAPLVGRDVDCAKGSLPAGYFNPRAPCGARHFFPNFAVGLAAFQPTRPLRGATSSTGQRKSCSTYFNPRAPCGARHARDPVSLARGKISTHAPLAGRDGRNKCNLIKLNINFNPRAPCGARLCKLLPLPGVPLYFNPRAPCGARPPVIRSVLRVEKFQPTRPLRGATLKSAVRSLPLIYFNPRAPCGARLAISQFRERRQNFNPRAPCGARHGSPILMRPPTSYFNPRAPCGARLGGDLVSHDCLTISTHAPLAGRDS